MSPRIVEPPTFTSHSASAGPLGKVWSIVAVIGLTRSSSKFQVAVAGQGAGPLSSQTLCQCEANTRPPRAV